MMEDKKEEHQVAVIGLSSNFWLYSSRDGYDLTHPAAPDSDPIQPRLTLKTTQENVTIDPQKTALVVVDMQNIFLSPILERPEGSKGIQACNALLQHAIPACRKAGIQIIWLNWGLTESDLRDMPPSTMRTFGFATRPAPTLRQVEEASPEPGFSTTLASSSLMSSGKDPRIYKGMGSEMGVLELGDGSKIDAGRMLMRDQWNTALYRPLEAARQQGLTADKGRNDVWIHKNRASGLWGPEGDCERYLQEQGIRTLLFAGVNTDQCVGGTLQDAFTKGYDCLLLRDGAATSSPQFAQQCVEYNVENVMGFLLSCEDLARGVEEMK